VSSERALFEAFAQAANGYSRDTVVGAAGNVLANALRQSHRTRGAAEEELDALVVNIKRSFANHYNNDGTRKERRLVLPPLFPVG
jgi:hypothetical protein